MIDALWLISLGYLLMALALIALYGILIAGAYTIETLLRTWKDST